MALRKYRNSAARTLAAPIPNPTTTSMTVDSASGFPTQFPYTLIIDPDGALEEVVDVTAAVGNVLTIVRGVDSTTPAAHAAGVKVVHGVSARDFQEANDHVNGTANVHGTTGFLVDTDSTQTVVGQKTFTGGLKTGGGNVIDTSSTQTVTGAKTFSGGLSTSTGGAVVDTGSSQTVSGTKTFSADQVFTGKVQVNNSVMRPTNVTSSNDDWTTSSSFVSSNTQPIVGTTFVAPPSGMVWVHLSAYMGQDNNQYEAIVGFRVGNGNVVGGGTDFVAPTGDRALVCGMAVNAAAPARLQAGDLYLVNGLTAGATYNVHVMFATTAGGKCWVYRRTLDIIPIF